MFRRIGEATGFASRPSGAADGPSGGTSQPGAPLELIRYNTSTHKFELGEEALQSLRRIRGPVGVIAVSGRARQGKSFILNQLLGRSTGFQVAPSVRPCTKGLWMWSTPIERTTPDGSKYHLVLLDTEGIDAYDQASRLQFASARRQCPGNRCDISQRRFMPLECVLTADGTVLDPDLQLGRAAVQPVRVQPDGRH